MEETYLKRKVYRQQASHTLQVVFSPKWYCVKEEVGRTVQGLDLNIQWFDTVHEVLQRTAYLTMRLLPFIMPLLQSNLNLKS